MPKCPRCGNEDFSEIQIKPGEAFSCPVPGCDGVIRPQDVVICRRLPLGAQWLAAPAPQPAPQPAPENTYGDALLEEMRGLAQTLVQQNQALQSSHETAMAQMQAEMARLRQQLNTQEQGKRLGEMLLQALSNHPMNEAERRTLQETDYAAPIQAEELRFLGVKDENELKALGMEDDLLELLRAGINLGRLCGLLQRENTPALPTDFNALPYTVGLGLLYEQLMRQCYYASLYAPWYRRCMAETAVPEPQAPEDTPLSFYDKGPQPLDKFGMPLSWLNQSPWSGRNMAEAFHQFACIQGQRLPAAWWQRFFSDLTAARHIRNRLAHEPSISLTEARNFAALLLLDLPDRSSLMKRILLCKGAAFAQAQ